MADGGGSAGGGSTSWWMSIPAMVYRIGTMDSHQAGQDAKALAELINRMFRAAGELSAGFGSDDLQGQGAASSTSQARDIFSDVTSAAASVAPGVGALNAAQNVMENASAQVPKLEAMQAAAADNPFISPTELMSDSSRLMTGTYNPPMSAAADAAPSAPTSGLGQSGGGVGGIGGGLGAPGGGSGAGGTRVSAGNASDMGEYGSTSGGPAAAAVTDPGQTPPSSGPSPTQTASPSGSSQDSSSKSSGNDDPAGVDRGGRGSPEGGVPTTNPAGLVPVSAVDKPLSFGGRGGGGSGIGGAGGAGAGGLSELSRRPLAGAPSVSASGAGTGGGSAANAARSGGMPTSGAPHGGGRGKAGEDSKHKAAHYLHTRDSGEEIVGSLPLVGPPVIGDWAPSGPAAEESAASADGEKPDKPLDL